jgi:hypothetical protein
VDAVRRGYLGLMLFIIALVLMPLLVVDYHRHTASDDKKRAPALVDVSTTARATTVPGAPSAAPTAAPTAATGPAIVTFLGVEAGATLTGDVAITLITTGDVGPVSYTLRGFPGQWFAANSPYLFSPHPGGWQTTQVVNGTYTLIATPVDSRIKDLSVTFRVQNP